jgi:phosphonate transport system substrate-binding protein
MNSSEAFPSADRSFSLRRVGLLLIPLIVAVAGFVLYQRYLIEAQARQLSNQLMLEKLGLGKPIQNRLDPRFKDADGDLVADPPAADQQVDPDTLIFSYVGSKDAPEQQEVWQQFLDALAVATGKKVEYLSIDSPDEQLRALKNGQLHIAGLNTGNVPRAVTACGFVPVCTLGIPDGSFGYKMQIIVPANSTVQKVEDLRGKRIALTDRLSNSGFKVPLVLLKDEFGLQPERDFMWSFTFSHDESIRGIAAGDFEAAPVASDMLARAISHGEIKPEQFRTIYESERFPPAALGYVYNLKPELAEKVVEVFSTFKWPGTALEKEFAPANVSAFVPINYKDDWSLIRRIDDAMGTIHVMK